MKHLVAFLRFWYDFVIGDDWRVALGVATGIALTAILASADVAAWWVMPIAVVVTVVASLRRAVRAGE